MKDVGDVGRTKQNFSYTIQYTPTVNSKMCKSEENKPVCLLKKKMKTIEFSTNYKEKL